MKLALFGYGKMGKMIEKVALERGHSIVERIDVDRPPQDFSAMDAAIDFSTPESAFDNITSCFDNGVPVISGTTGWLDRYEEAVSHCKRNKGAFIYASNFSLGVNVFFQLNRYLAQMMGKLEQYEVSLEETHHVHKVDAPSGTAITIAEGIVENSRYKGWEKEEAPEGYIPIVSKRIGEVPGTHIVAYQSSVDSLEIKHTAHNREGFALGAVVAAEWLVGKQGIFGMADVLGLQK